MAVTIAAPLTGTVIPLTEVPDPVFAKALVGPGVAIDPGEVATLTVTAPVAGKLTSLKPHAYVISRQPDQGVLVHLGIDTVHLKGAGFTLRAEAGQQVEAGEEIVVWDLAAAREAEKSVVVPVVVLETDAENLTLAEAGPISSGDPLIRIS
ncbi:PTS system N-acetylglucosamine-specific IIA component, Glc family [Brevibacterium siliguriense]|uniref:PTS system N-acetylglucosamine-specific IIA component, Glc family n=1 Tax=Brevibacterium siliguriense TaxID=1136497 RepID=A0A1H1RUA2_9MICO|nr:PTS glucose transporter subunit IIA [Brevibacterium siliguriense]SDS39260.1 PTS system N-acetylglucosamine-specific IIA component, Glc family [Brevibacterium siliguriense]